MLAVSCNAPVHRGLDAVVTMGVLFAAHAAVERFVAELSGTCGKFTDATAARTAVIFGAKSTVVAEFGIEVADAVSRRVANIVRARVGVGTIRRFQALDAGVDRFIATTTRTGDSRSRAGAARASVGGCAKQAVVTGGAVVDRRKRTETVHACIIRAPVFVVAISLRLAWATIGT